MENHLTKVYPAGSSVLLIGNKCFFEIWLFLWTVLGLFSNSSLDISQNLFCQVVTSTSLVHMVDCVKSIISFAPRQIKLGTVVWDQKSQAKQHKRQKNNR
jgi:hypothetical protein